MIFKTNNYEKLLLELSKILNFNYDKETNLELSKRIYKRAKLIGMIKNEKFKYRIYEIKMNNKNISISIYENENGIKSYILKLNDTLFKNNKISF
ncbi:unknown [Clostridium sp. CAG:354]|nr:unknown [Clostridium sp. CAG:354]